MSNPAQKVESAVTRKLGGALLAGIGAFIAISIVAVLAVETGYPWVLGSFGASCVLLFGFPNAPFSRTRSAFGGHCLSTLIGLCCLHWFGPGWPVMAAATALALMTMMLTDTVHPPAGSNPIIIFMSHADWSFLLFPTVAGIALLIAIAKVYRYGVQLLQSDQGKTQEAG